MARRKDRSQAGGSASGRGGRQDSGREPTAHPANGGNYQDYIFGFSLILPAAPVAVLVYCTWDLIASSLNYPKLENWIFPAQLVGVSIELLTVIFFVEVVYKDLPRALAAAITSLYLAVTYLMAAQWLDVAEPWVGVVAVLTGTLGYFLGKRLSVRPSGGEGWRLPGIELALASVGVLALQYGPGLAQAAAAPAWAAEGLAWAGAILVSIGVCALFGRFPRTFVLTGVAGAAVWAATAQ
jgi:hypothetical protein